MQPIALFQTWHLIESAAGTLDWESMDGVQGCANPIFIHEA